MNVMFDRAEEEWQVKKGHSRVLICDAQRPKASQSTVCHNSDFTE
jgi:hypothetical protein